MGIDPDDGDALIRRTSSSMTVNGADGKTVVPTQDQCLVVTTDGRGDSLGQQATSGGHLIRVASYACYWILGSIAAITRQLLQLEVSLITRVDTSSATQLVQQLSRSNGSRSQVNASLRLTSGQRATNDADHG